MQSTKRKNSFPNSPSLCQGNNNLPLTFSGPSRVLVLAKTDAIRQWRTLMGNTNPTVAKKEKPKRFRDISYLFLVFVLCTEANSFPLSTLCTAVTVLLRHKERFTSSFLVSSINLVQRTNSVEIMSPRISCQFSLKGWPIYARTNPKTLWYIHEGFSLITVVACRLALPTQSQQANCHNSHVNNKSALS